MAKGICRAIFLYRVSFPLRTLGKNYQRIVAGIAVLVSNQDFNQVYAV